MKVVFKIIQANSGSDVYFKILEQELKARGVEVETYYYPKIFQFFPFFLKFVDNEITADIIHSNIEYGWVFKKKNIPLVVTVLHIVFEKEFQKHTSLFQKLFHYLILRPNTKKSLQIANKTIAISKYTQKSVYREFGKRKNIDVIYNGIDPSIFKPINIRPYGDNKFHLLFVGNLIRRKGADLLPKIMQQLGDKYILHYTRGLRSKQPKSFDGDNMIPLGKLSLNSLVKEYNKCDALLLPSRLEGFGYAVVEAMACGKPVIISDNSSLPELIDNKCGEMFVVSDINSIIRSIKIVASKKYDSRYISGRVSYLFSLKRMVFIYKNIYSTVVKRRLT